MSEMNPTMGGERIVGVLRDKSVADRMIRALVHSGFEPERIVVAVSGVNELSFSAHEPGVKILKFPLVSETGTFAVDRASNEQREILSLGIPETRIREYESMLRDGDVLIGVTCAGKCDLARSLFLDAGSSHILTPDSMDTQPYNTPNPDTYVPSGPTTDQPDMTGRPDMTDQPDRMAEPREQGGGMILKDNPYDDRWDLEHRPDEGGLLEDDPRKRDYPDRNQQS